MLYILKLLKIVPYLYFVALEIHGDGMFCLGAEPQTVTQGLSASAAV